MKNHTEYTQWIYVVLVIAIILCVLYLIAYYNIKKAKKNYKTAKKRQEELREDVTRINETLLDSGMSYGDIREFWDECFVEGQIRYSLAPCTCNDVNQCETWCQAKARFTLNPPID